MELDGFTPWNESMAAEFERRTGYPALRAIGVDPNFEIAGRPAGEYHRLVGNPDGVRPL